MLDNKIYEILENSEKEICELLMAYAEETLDKELYGVAEDFIVTVFADDLQRSYKPAFDTAMAMLKVLDIIRGII